MSMLPVQSSVKSGSTPPLGETPPKENMSGQSYIQEGAKQTTMTGATEQPMNGADVEPLSNVPPKIGVHYDTLAETKIPLAEVTLKDVVDHPVISGSTGLGLGAAIVAGAYYAGVNTMDRGLASLGLGVDAISLKAIKTLCSDDIENNQAVFNYYNESAKKFDEAYQKFTNPNSSHEEKASGLEEMRRHAYGAQEFAKASKNLTMLSEEKNQAWMDLGFGCLNLLFKDAPKIASAFAGDTFLGSAMQTQAFGKLAGSGLSVVTGSVTAYNAYQKNEELQGIKQQTRADMKEARHDLEKMTESEVTKRFAKHSIRNSESSQDKQGSVFWSGVLSALSGIATLLTTSFAGVAGVAGSLAAAIGISAGAAAIIATGGLIALGASACLLGYSLYKSYQHSVADRQLLSTINIQDDLQTIKDDDLQAAKDKIRGDENSREKFKIVTDKFLKTLPEELKGLTKEILSEDPMGGMSDMVLNESSILHNHAVRFLENFGGQSVVAELTGSDRYDPDCRKNAIVRIENHLVDEFGKLELAKENAAYALNLLCENLKDGKAAIINFLEKAMGKEDVMRLQLLAQSSDSDRAEVREALAQHFLIHQ